MKQKRKIIITILLIIFLLIVILIGLKIKTNVISNKKYGNWISDSDYLYDVAINYLKEDKYKSLNTKGKNDYQVFYNYEGFGIKEKENKKYAYMYIAEESYYVNHDKLYIDGINSMPYKFTFENNNVVNYETPNNGIDYTNSVKEMFPDDIEKKVLNFGYENLKINDDIEKHYSYLNSTIAMYEDYDERAIVITGNYNDNLSSDDINTIYGKYIDGYGDIYEYKIPSNNKHELLVNVKDIDDNIVLDYKGEKISSISREDLEIIKSNISNLREENIDKNVNKETQTFFVKVVHKKNGENNTISLSYNNSIDLIMAHSNKITENISDSSKNILNILKKYNILT